MTWLFYWGEVDLKKYQFVIFIIILLLCPLLPFDKLYATGLELDDFSGQTGPAPPPAPYATTILSIADAPTDVSQFRIEINYGKDVLSGHFCKLKEPIKSWQYTKVGHLSSSTRNAYYIDCWTTDTPISAGSTLDLAEITFEVKSNTSLTVKLENLEHDFDGWSANDGIFTPANLGAAPVANAGPDQIVTNEVTLDGSLSDDPDGSIVSYRWQLRHRQNSDYDRIAEGVMPEIASLQKGFYDVTLTVTDNAGTTDIDHTLLVATGNEKKVVVVPLF